MLDKILQHFEDVRRKVGDNGKWTGSLFRSH